MIRLIQKLFLITIFTNGIYMVFGDDDKFPVYYADQIHEFESLIEHFKTLLNDSMNIVDDNAQLIEFLDDFDTIFKPALKRLSKLHAEYANCCHTYDDVYATYLSKANSLKKNAKFQKIVDQWNTIVQMRTGISAKMKMATEQFAGLQNEGGIFYQIFNQVKSGNYDSSLDDEWAKVCKQAIRISNGIKKTKSEFQCPDVQQFLSSMKKCFE
ncbi:uncharacterized protein LOC116337356 [Contarinia nasturtii]|uniref:uncharacterized protein LOC116337356 n=1 Tax=Contarinia nasturtii TaxID=265458 RepID=UPI0012D4720A|nr:uncharacterized protein LOC116337356 [Contarinia nasturtii]